MTTAVTRRIRIATLVIVVDKEDADALLVWLLTGSAARQKHPSDAHLANRVASRFAALAFVVEHAGIGSSLRVYANPAEICASLEAGLYQDQLGRISRSDTVIPAAQDHGDHASPNDGMWP